MVIVMTKKNLPTSEKVRVGRRIIEVKHLDRLYFPEDHITKYDVMAYYHHVGETMLKYTRHHPLTMQRFPAGIHGEHFYQKDAPAYFPSWIETQLIKKKTMRGSDRYVIGNQVATLVYLASQGCITPHCWLSTVDALNYPDRMIFDIDPPHGESVDFEQVKNIAFQLKVLLEDAGVKPWVMTTGSRGLHVVVALKQDAPFDDVRAGARALASLIVERDPEKVTLESRAEKRQHKMMIDVMRNGFGATAVAPYALRALPGAPVATPITWDELKTLASSQAYTLTTIPQRLTKHGDAWRMMKRSKTSLRKLLHYYKTV
jgi:bifunctional non-homologous end joining protein LigD